MKTPLPSEGDPIEKRREWVKRKILPAVIRFAPEREQQFRNQIEDDAQFEALWKVYFSPVLSWKHKELEIWEAVKLRRAA